MTAADRGIRWSTAGSGIPDAGLQAQAAQVFAGDLAADREPSVRAIRAASCRAARAQPVQAYLAALTS
jgi:hypothetical protein